MKEIERINMPGNLEGIVEDYEVNRLAHVEVNKKNKKIIPAVDSKLRHRYVLLPEVIYRASGILIQGKRIKSILFSTDLAIIRNNNANAILAVYPFTPELSIMQSIIQVANVPVFSGIGGGTTSGERSVQLALQAELLGSYGAVVNAPMTNEVIRKISRAIDVPLIATVASDRDDIVGKIDAGANILNISAGKHTSELVRDVRKIVGEEFPIIATGGHREENIEKTIDAGANAITYTPPTSGEIFQSVMEDYRKR